MNDQRKIKEFLIRLKNGESVILELLLLSYPLMLIAENTLVAPHYLIIALSILGGIGAYLLFEYIQYQIGYTILIAAAISLPFYFIGLPLTVVIFIFIYTLWRYHDNFGLSRGIRWNFLAINTIVFTFFYFITRSFLRIEARAEANEVNVLLFILITLLYVLLRYVVFLAIKYAQSDMKMGGINRFFALIIGAGVGTFLVVYYFVAFIRTAILAVAGLLFSGIFMWIAQLVTPFIDYIIDYLDYLRYKAYQEMEPPELGYVEFQLDEERTIGSGAMVDLSLYIGIAVVVIAVVAIVLIVRKRGRVSEDHEEKSYTIRSFGRKKHVVKEATNWQYGERSTTDEVRLAYQAFEKEAHAAEATRLVGETVKEWFSRMDWGVNEVLFSIYDSVRYGENIVTEEERNLFMNELEKIKELNFKKDV